MKGTDSKLNILKELYNGLLRKQLALDINIKADESMLLKYPELAEQLNNQIASTKLELEKTTKHVQITMEMILDLEKSDA